MGCPRDFWEGCVVLLWQKNRDTYPEKEAKCAHK